MPSVDIEPAKLFDSRLSIRARIDCPLACSYGGSCGGNEDYSIKANRGLLEKSFKKTHFLKNTPDETLDFLSNYPEMTTCEP